MCRYLMQTSPPHGNWFAKNWPALIVLEKGNSAVWLAVLLNMDCGSILASE